MITIAKGLIHLNIFWLAYFLIALIQHKNVYNFSYNFLYHILRMNLIEKAFVCFDAMQKYVVLRNHVVC